MAATGQGQNPLLQFDGDSGVHHLMKGRFKFIDGGIDAEHHSGGRILHSQGLTFKLDRAPEGIADFAVGMGPLAE